MLIAGGSLAACGGGGGGGGSSVLSFDRARHPDGFGFAVMTTGAATRSPKYYEIVVPSGAKGLAVDVVGSRDGWLANGRVLMMTRDLDNLDPNYMEVNLREGRSTITVERMGTERSTEEGERLSGYIIDPTPGVWCVYDETVASVAGRVEIAVVGSNGITGKSPELDVVGSVYHVLGEPYRETRDVASIRDDLWWVRKAAYWGCLLWVGGGGAIAALSFTLEYTLADIAFAISDTLGLPNVDELAMYIVNLVGDSCGAIADFVYETAVAQAVGWSDYEKSFRY